MNCLLAIILLMGEHNYRNGRLVVMELGEQAKVHHTYRLAKVRKFRQTMTHTGIFMAASPIKHAGTYLTIYCSLTLSAKNLEAFIANGANKLTMNSALGFHQSVTSEEKCLRYLRNGYKALQKKKSRGENELNALPYIRDGKCTESLIYSLALQGEISLHAKYNINIEQQCEKTIVVAYHNGLRMDSIVLHGQILYTVETQQKDFVLAWYQGELEVFVKPPSSNVWSLERTESNETPDRRLIIDLVAHRFHGVRAIIEALNRLNQKITDRSEQRHSINLIGDINKLLANFSKDEKFFITAQATGFFGAEPPTQTVSS
ncbi:putative effector protein [Blumeria hordei DH14]|uniref:Putative effector protein n=1 Tax=Blumeria graminis f. sp. hordei (strain DH14) TaxID=546991 RepID=N1JEX2_BLUG1|nr:putative effector protein [Blumeria hordei DH14]